MIERRRFPRAPSHRSVELLEDVDPPRVILVARHEEVVNMGSNDAQCFWLAILLDHILPETRVGLQPS